MQRLTELFTYAMMAIGIFGWVVIGYMVVQALT